VGKSTVKRKGPLFAVGDIHGCVAELRALINLLPLTPDSTVVFVGDYIDRGPHAKDVVDTVLELARTHRVVCLMGNHERMLLDFVAAPQSAQGGRFIYNGGSATLASYGDDAGNFRIPEDHLDFCRSLSMSYQQEGFFFVHAGVPNLPLAEVDDVVHANEMLWIRGAFHNSDYPWSQTIVHGHTPVKEVDRARGRINIDTGCVYNRCLTAIQLPQGILYSTPRQPDSRRVFLRDKSSRREAVRFEGAVPVRLSKAGQRHEFHTIDYNEFGMFTQNNDPDKVPLWETGDIVLGEVGEVGEECVAIEGEIVRTDREADTVAYAVKMLQTPAGPEA
jgi:serine/threonine protein phosphatase 1